MNRTTRFGAVVGAAVLALSVGLASPAYAAPKDDDKVARAQALNDQYLGDPNASKKLSADDLALMQEYGKVAEVETKVKVEKEDPLTGALEPVEVSEDGITTFAAWTCYRGSYEYRAYGIAGNYLYKSWHVGRWCTNASTVSSSSIAESGGAVYWLGWSNLGRINGGSGIVSYEGRSWTQYKFSFQLGTPYPTQQTNPCNRVRGAWSGTYYGSHTCSLY